MDINAAGGRDAGLTDVKLAAISEYETSSLFSEKERLALRYADGITLNERDVTDHLFAELQAHYTTAEIVEMTAIAALENFRSRLNHALRLEAQGFYCARP